MTTSIGYFTFWCSHSSKIISDCMKPNIFFLAVEIQHYKDFAGSLS